MLIRERRRAMPDCTDARPHEPFLEDSDATYGTLIEKLPYRRQVGLDAFERKLFLEGQQNVLENLPVRGGVGPIALEVKIEAAAAQLCTEIAKGKQLICAQQNMHGPGAIRDGLDYVQLIREPASGGDPCQMLRFVDKHNRRTTVTERLLGGVTQIGVATDAYSA